MTSALQSPDPVAAVLAELVREGAISADQAELIDSRLLSSSPAASRVRPSSPAASRVRPPAAAGDRGGPPSAGSGGLSARLAEVAGYLGGALVLGAVALFVSSEWSTLSEGVRAALLCVTTVVLAAAGAALLVGAGGRQGLLGREHSPRRRLVSTSWTFAAASAAGAAGVLADRHELLAASAVGLIVAALAYALAPTALGQLAAWATTVSLAMSGVDVLLAGDAPDPYALTLLFLGALWAGGAVIGLFRERETGLVLAVVTACVGGQLPLIVGDGNLGYLLTGMVAVGCFAGYLWVRSWPVLAGGVVATTLVVPEAVYDLTDGSVPAAGVLLVAGFTLLAASAVGLRLRRVS